MRQDYSCQFGQRIIIHGKTRTEFLDVSQITHFDSKNALVTAYTTDENISVAKQLKEFEEELKDLGFIRINRSTLINQAFIKYYTGGENKIVELINGQQFTVSRRKAHLFKL